jgi:uncharacterized delta-60 repeat protein
MAVLPVDEGDLEPTGARRPRFSGAQRRTLTALAALVTLVGAAVVVTNDSRPDRPAVEVRNDTATAAPPPLDGPVEAATAPSTQPEQPVDLEIGPSPTLLPRRPKPSGSSSTTRPKVTIPATLPVTLPTYPPGTPVVTIPDVGVPPVSHPWQGDPTFASGGLYTKSFTKGLEMVSALAVQPDGKILVGGDTPNARGDADMVLVRLHPNGTPDPSFGDGGVVRYDTGTSEHPHVITVQPNGKILVAGRTGAFRSADKPGGVMRLLPNGDLDASFADAGVLTTDHSSVNGLVVLPDGKLVVVGTEGDPIRQTDISLARYSATGQADPSFGTNGRTLIDTGSTPTTSWWDEPLALARLDGGALMVVGQRSTAGSADCICASALLVRFTADGNLDKGFNQTGWRTLEFSSFNSASAVLAASGGRAVVAVVVSGTDNRQALLRIRPDGSLDPTFGQQGVTRFAAGNVSAVTRDPLGRIVAATGGSAFELRRFTADGAADPTFGGTYRSDVEAHQTEFPTAVVVQADGRIVYGGYVYRDTRQPSPTGQYDTDWVVERISLR